MKSAYELAMERLEKKEPTKKLTDSQKERITELETLYKSKVAEKETFLNAEVAKEMARGDFKAVEQIKDQLAREKRRLAGELEEKKATIHGETATA